MIIIFTFKNILNSIILPTFLTNTVITMFIYFQNVLKITFMFVHYTAIKIFVNIKINSSILKNKTVEGKWRAKKDENYTIHKLNYQIKNFILYFKKIIYI